MTLHPQYSEVNLLCTYVWYYHRDEYTWYAFDTTPQWDGQTNPVPVHGHEGNRSIFSPDMLRPKPRVAIHARFAWIIEISVFYQVLNNVIVVAILVVYFART